MSRTKVSRQLTDAEVRSLFGSAALYPSHLKPRENCIVFAKLDREAYRRVTFLANEVSAIAEETVETTIPTLQRHQREEGLERRRPKSIFHTAFCGSTLLARALDDLGALVLKEPGILVEVCWTARSCAASRATNRWWARLLRRDFRRSARRDAAWASDVRDLVLGLLARPMANDAEVIVKANDMCNDSIVELSGPAGIFLYGSLPDFVASVLKHETRRQWIRSRSRYFDRLSRELGLLGPAQPSPADDHLKAALLWSTYLRAYSAATSGPAGANVLALPTERLMDDPCEALRAVCGHFGLPASGSAISAVVAGETFQRHAKARAKPFDRDAWRRERDELRGQFKAEIHEALAWAHRVDDPDALLTAALGAPVSS